MVEEEPTQVAHVGVLHQRHLLMGRRRDNGLWTTPGGHLNPGEDPRTGAARELLEEAGVAVVPSALAPLASIDVSPTLTVHAFLHAPAERPQTSMRDDPDAEVHRWYWVPLDALPPDDELHVPRDRNLVLQAISNLLATEAPEPTEISDAKEADMAKLDTEERDDLKDSDFAVPGKRKLPIKDAGHVRSAMGRLHQTEGLTSEEKAEARKRILAAAKRFGIDASGFEKEMTDVVLSDVEVMTDAVGSGPPRLRFKGAVANTVNANRRLYPLGVLTDAVNRLKARLPVVGEMPHPPVVRDKAGRITFDSNPSNAAMKIIDAFMDGPVARFIATPLRTSKGQDLQVHVDEKLPVGCSIRMIGDSVQRMIDGVPVDVATHLDIHTWDVVGNPATEGCGLEQVLTDSHVAQLLADPGDTPEQPAAETPVTDGAALTPPACPQCSGPLTPMDPDQDGDVDFYACLPCGDAYCSDDDVRQQTVVCHSLSKITPANLDAYPLAQEWLSQHAKTMTDTATDTNTNTKIDTATEATRKDAKMDSVNDIIKTQEFSAAVAEEAKKAALEVTKHLTDAAEAQRQAEVNAQAKAAAKTEAKAFLDAKYASLKDKYNQKTIDLIADAVGEPETKELAEALFDSQIKTFSAVGSRAFLDGLGFDPANASQQGRQRIEVGDGPRYHEAFTDALCREFDEYAKTLGHTYDPKLRELNHKEGLPKILGRFDEKHARGLFTDSTRSFVDAVQSGAVMNDSISMTLSNVLNQPTILRAILVQAFQDVESLQFVQVDTEMTGSEFRWPVESYTGAATYDAAKFIMSLAVAEGAAVPEATVNLNWLNFSPTWQRVAVSLNNDVIRQLAHGPLKYSAIARALYHITNEKRRVLDNWAYSEMFLAADEYGYLAITNETPILANVTATGGTLNGVATNAAFSYNVRPAGFPSSPGATPGYQPLLMPRSVTTIGANSALTTTASYVPSCKVSGTALVLGYWDGQNIQNFAGTTATFAVDFQHGTFYFTSGSGISVGATPVLPTNVAYWASTNFDRWSTTITSGLTQAEYYDSFVAQLTNTAAIMGSSPRFRKPNLGIFDLTAATYFENARINYKIGQPVGTRLIDTGNSFGERAGMQLSKINAPWCPYPAARVLLSTRYSTKYGMETPWEVEGPYPIQDVSSGRIIDAKRWLGRENSVMATPQVKDPNGNVQNPFSRTIVLNP